MTSPWSSRDTAKRLVMCCLCFSSVELDKLITDENGYLVDVCKTCRIQERMIEALYEVGRIVERRMTGTNDQNLSTKEIIDFVLEDHKR